MKWSRVYCVELRMKTLNENGDCIELEHIKFFLWMSEATDHEFLKLQLDC